VAVGGLLGEPFGFAPWAPVPWGIGSIDRLGDNTLEAEIVGVLQDECALAGLTIIGLRAQLVSDQRLEQHLALDERQGRNVPAVEVQEIEA
jgi:hypothetical protein